MSSLQSLLLFNSIYFNSVRPKPHAKSNIELGGNKLTDERAPSPSNQSHVTFLINKLILYE